MGASIQEVKDLMKYHNDIAINEATKTGDVTGASARTASGNRRARNRKDPAKVRSSREFLETFGAWKDYPSAEEMIEIIKSRR